MIESDLHSHTLMSLCGIHTAVEMLEYAQKCGLKGLAVTDHGPLLGGRLPSTFFDRFVNPVKGIRLYKGIELNLKEEGDDTDLPLRFLQFCDILLLGIHETLPRGKTPDWYTDRILSAIRKNRYIDGITHPNSIEFPVDYLRLAEGAKELGVALELNNSKVLHKRVPDEETRKLIRACMTARCPVMVNTDSHVVNELGNTSHIEALMKELDFPETLIVNRTVSTTNEWLDPRRQYKKTG